MFRLIQRLQGRSYGFSQLRQFCNGDIRDGGEKGVVQSHKSYAVYPTILRVSPSTP